jgi:quinol-cytochrome oxidoreductase complex cytochrome b subunit
MVRIWRSVFRGPVVPRTDRERRWVVFHHLVLHWRPIRLPESTLRYTHTWGLGGMSLVLVTMLAATGILMMFVYEPSPARAHDSIVNLEADVLFGQLVRNVHYWSANLLVVVVFLHMLRVFLTGAFHGPRQFNWLLGLGLLLCVLLSNFTGYLLPWDQLSYWAITISTGMIAYVPGLGSWLQEAIRGGTQIGPATVINFYTYHTTVGPVLIILLMAFHFWRVRKAGGVVIPPVPGEAPDEKPRHVLFVPNLLLREAVVVLVLIALVLSVAVLFDAPLGAPANPGMSPNPAKAPWYFLGIQELLLHFHPTFAVLVIPLAAAGALVLIPYVRYDSDLAGAWFLSRKGRQMGTVAAVTALVTTPVWIVLDEFTIDLAAWLPGVPPLVANGLLPVALLLAVIAGFYHFLKRGFSASNNETIQALFILLMVSFLVLTVTGIWFRGAGMALTWPGSA